MTFSRLFQGQDTGGGGVDRLFFTKADPQPFRHPLLTHLQHTLHSQLDGTGSVSGNLNGKQGFGSGSGVGHDYFYSTPHRHSHGWLGGGGHGGGGGGSGKHKEHKSNSTALSALTLLAFLFFLNLLQNCLREQMETMNPTVMVMTAGAVRERLEKSAEQPPDAETEPFFPEERVRINASPAASSSTSSAGANYHRRRPNFAYEEEDDDDAREEETIERSRFQKISLASSSSRQSTTSPKSLVFRTRF